MLEETTYYYFTPEGERQGPYSLQELKAMVDAGRIPMSASVLSSINQNWHLLVDVLRGNHPLPMSRRHKLGNCPHCHEAVTSVADVKYGKCPNCGYPIGTPRKVYGIRRRFLYTLRKRYFCFSGRAERVEYWSFIGTLAFGMTVMAVLGFALLLLSLEDFNVHLVNGRSFLELVRDSGGYGITHYVFAGMIGLFTLAFIVPACGVTTRRLHDAGHTGLWFLPVFLMTTAFVAGAGAFWLAPELLANRHGVLDIILHPGYIAAMVVAFIVVMIVLPWQDSQVGGNKYGPSPKYPQ